MAAARGQVVFEVQPGLRRLLRDVAAEVVDGRRRIAAVRTWCPLLSLPHLFGMQAPAPPYLTAEADRVAAWRERIGTHGRRIGIAWQGNPAAPPREAAPSRCASSCPWRRCRACG